MNKSKIVALTAVLLVLLFTVLFYLTKIRDSEQVVDVELKKIDTSYLIATNQQRDNVVDVNAPEVTKSFKDLKARLEDPKIRKLSEQASEDPESLEKLLKILPELDIRGVRLTELVRSNYSKNRKIPFQFEILDQDGGPVSSASINIVYRKLGLGINAAFDRETLISDESGTFRVPDKAVSFKVEATKPGYEIESFSGSFVGKGEINLHNLKNKTSNFVLNAWKEVSSEKLLTGKVLYRLPTQANRLLLPIPGIGNSLLVSVNKDLAGSTKAPGSWQVELQVNDGGGLIQSMEKFPYLAPETGYETHDRIDFDNSVVKFPPFQYQKSYFIQSQSEQVYGWITLAFVPYNSNNDLFYIYVNYRVNESGSRVLRLDESTANLVNQGTVDIGSTN